MSIIDLRRIRDDKMNKMLNGESVHAESTEMVRLLKRAIKRQSLHVQIDYSNGSYWFMLAQDKK